MNENEDKIYIQCMVHFESAPDVTVTFQLSPEVKTATDAITAAELFMKNIVRTEHYLAGKMLICTKHISFIDCKFVTGAIGGKFKEHEEYALAWREEIRKRHINSEGTLLR